MTTRATLVRRSASLATDFGRSYAERLFGVEAIAAQPTYTRGPRKGQPKGYLLWLRCERGGWANDHWTGIARPGKTFAAWVGASEYSTPEAALRGPWHGRVQQLAGHSDVLGERGDARHTTEMQNLPPAEDFPLPASQTGA